MHSNLQTLTHASIEIAVCIDKHLNSWCPRTRRSPGKIQMDSNVQIRIISRVNLCILPKREIHDCRCASNTSGRITIQDSFCNTLIYAKIISVENEHLDHRKFRPVNRRLLTDGGEIRYRILVIKKYIPFYSPPTQILEAYID